MIDVSLSAINIYDPHRHWGICTAINAYECDSTLIRNEKIIKIFVHELCREIKMKRFGECQVIHFGEDERVAGFSFTQLIETSLISGHFRNQTNAAYIDVFSCAYYDPKQVVDMVNLFFGPKHIKFDVTFRE